MPRMNGTGPDKQGTQTGRGLGRCCEVSDKTALAKLGKGMRMRRKSGGGLGQGKRIKAICD